MSRWDFLDTLGPIDISGMNPEQVATMFKHFDEEDRKKILDDLRNAEADEKRRKRALDVVAKIGEFVIEKGIDLVI